MNVEEYIKQGKKHSYALKRWGIEGILDGFRKGLDYFLNLNKFDLDEYCGLFLASMIIIEDFKDEKFYNDIQLKEISQFDSEILRKTVKVQINIYNLESIEKEVFDQEKYWFLYRIPEEAIDRLKLRDYLFL